MASELQVTTIRGVPTGANANQIVVASGQTLTAPGHIIQVQHQQFTTADIATTTSDYPQASGVKMSITPKFATSTIMIIANIATWLDSGSNINQIGKWGLRLNSQGNTIVGDKRVSHMRNVADSGRDFGAECTIVYAADPNSTSLQEYEIMFGRWSSAYDNTVKINGGGFGHTSMTLMEIAQ
tara:strand:+ start:10 stop:555 length:546 start_codon:yes stop_codon:yes gene_type:complete